MIKLNDLSMTYGDIQALEKVNLMIQAKDKVAIVGGSGCGKTTLLHLVAGILQPTFGSVTIHDKPVTFIRKGTAILLQNDGLFPWKNVYQNVALGLLNQPLTKEVLGSRVMDILKALEIHDYSNKSLHELSGGQRQRVAIARALVQNPDLLLMDEPTASLDMLTKEKFQETLHQLNDLYDMTSIIVTHDIEEAAYLGMKILVMKDGKIVKVIHNPYYGMKNLREQLCFYELCLEIRQVMKS